MDFYHNGKDFNIKDIDGVTGIGISKKKEELNLIGKFGVGFKSVFAITKTPQIYSGEYNFEINDFVIPTPISNTFHKNGTLIRIPFNHTHRSKEEIFKHIYNRLKNLDLLTLLFLRNIKEISWQTPNSKGRYLKTETREENTIYIKLESSSLVDEYLLFRKLIDIDNNNLWVEVAYKLGKDQNNNNIIVPEANSRLIVFFPTEKVTFLNFLIQGPFKTTPNRENIPLDEEQNKKILNEIVNLISESLTTIKDLGYLNTNFLSILPINSELANRELIYSLAYKRIKEVLLSENLLPTSDGSYTKAGDALLARGKEITEFLDSNDIKKLFDRNKWLDTNITFDRTRELRDYLIYQLNIPEIEFENFARKISDEFLREKSDKWMIDFYRRLLDKQSLWSERTGSKGILREKPIIRLENNEHISPFDNNGKANVYLPTESKSKYKTVKKELTEDKEALKFLIELGLKKPDIFSEIKEFILPKYRKEKPQKDEWYFEDFEKILIGYEKIPYSLKNEYLKELSTTNFILATKNDGKEENYLLKANEIYFVNSELKDYFNGYESVFFLSDEIYAKFGEKRVKIFLEELGVEDKPRRIKIRAQLSWEEERKLRYNGRISYIIAETDYDYEGLDNFLNKKLTYEDSFLLWKLLLKSLEKLSSWAAREFFEGEYKWFYRREHSNSFDAKFLKTLREKAWLIDTYNNFKKPSEIYFSDLSNKYNHKSSNIDILKEKLSFKTENFINLSENERKILEIVKKRKLTPEELEKILVIIDKNPTNNEKEQKTNEDKQNKEEEHQKEKEISGIGEREQRNKEKNESALNTSSQGYYPKDDKHSGESEDENTIYDQNELEEIRKKIEVKKNRIRILEQLSKETKYSYNWFKAYIELLNTYAEKQYTTRQKSISFQKIIPYTPDSKYFLLYSPNDYIPTGIEDAEDLKILLIFNDGKREYLTIDAISRKGQELLIYCPQLSSNINISHFSNIFRIEINFTPVIDLLDRLYRAFTNNNYIDEWQDFLEAIPPLYYIYGPPGTGKTTNLSIKIDNLLTANPELKILVLTPTNKAADVFFKKLNEINRKNCSIRLSRPSDPELDENIYRDVISDDDMKFISVIISTIHRLPYYEIKNIGPLFSYQWDYVIFDEASMIGLHYIIFAIMSLFKTNSNITFIIGGDPKQIPPIIEINDAELEKFDLQDENIYKMMNLESFNPVEQKIRTIDQIENLYIQYRSVPNLGQLFSEFSYSNLLKHNRNTYNTDIKPFPERMKSLFSSNFIFIDIPLNQNNSIYKVSKLLYSSYHIYSALLIVEILKHFDFENISENWTFGIISPYKAQAIVLDKLISSLNFSKNIKVFSDTVHGFQGDECDMVFFICNPNNYYYTEDKRCLLSKEYIYNVAISRAKDYLVILHPFSINNPFIDKIITLYKNKFDNLKILNAYEIEKFLFNDDEFISKNVFISGHDVVNVFGLTEMRYFIKANDTAIDIQIRDFSKKLE